MRDKAAVWTPNIFQMLYKLIGLFWLCILWIIEGVGLAGLYLLLSISILMLLRWRFTKLTWTLILDQILIYYLAYEWNTGAYFLVLSNFELMYLGKPFLMIPTLIYCFLPGNELIFYLLLFQGAFTGYILRGWNSLRLSSIKRLDQDSRRYYELENLKQELLVANKQTARLAELAERSRIARDIHDHAGHEIVAAYMSLQTAQAYFQEEPKQAEELLGESILRLESGITKIRETIQNLTPLANIGIENIQRLCKDFQYCPIELSIYGDTTKVPVYLWIILEPCLKEALTNIISHSAARKVTVALDITPSIVRLCVENDGAKQEQKQELKQEQKQSSGVGLHNLRLRAAAVGGNVSTNITDEYRLVCVLPIE